jgi:TRAP transporter TAXI family solute receptor
VAELAAGAGAELIPIDGPRATALVQRNPLMAPMVIPEGTYTGVPATPTLSVAAQLLVSKDLDERLVYEMTRLLWIERTREALARGRGGEILLAPGVPGAQVPLHAGAKRYYAEAGQAAGGDPSR